MSDPSRRAQDRMIVAGLIKALQILNEELGRGHQVPLQAEQAELEDLLAKHKRKRGKTVRKESTGDAPS